MNRSQDKALQKARPAVSVKVTGTDCKAEHVLQSWTCLQPTTVMVTGCWTGSYCNNTWQYR